MEVVIMELRGLLHSSVLFILLCSFFSCNQWAELPMGYANSDTLKLKVSKGVYYYQKTPFTGVVYTLGAFPSDTLSLQKYLHGKKHGTWTAYYPNKQLKEKRTYHHGSKEGVHLRYWPNGQLRLQFHLRNDRYHGNSKAWNSTGTLISDRNFIDGQESGIQRLWYDDGKIKANFIIKNQRRYGLLGTKNCINVSDSIF